MCAFFATQIFTHPRLASTTYYLRLDTDSYLLSSPCSAPGTAPGDPFARMHARNASYGFRAVDEDPAWVTRGMWSLISSYSHSHPQVEAMLERNKWEWPGEREEEGMWNEAVPSYQNNFEVVNLERFRAPEVRAWLEEIGRDPERIFKYRWGASSLPSSLPCLSLLLIRFR